MRHLKRQRRRERTILLDSDLERTCIANPETDLQGRDLWARLASHLMQIPLDRRVTLVLRVVQGHTVAEVAEITSVPVNTARSRIRVALQELRVSISMDPGLMEVLGHR